MLEVLEKIRQEHKNDDDLLIALGEIESELNAKKYGLVWEQHEILFALSNIFCHKGKTNDNLTQWSEKYQVYYFDKTYSNCSYHFKDRETKTLEVLVTNFKSGIELTSATE